MHWVFLPLRRYFDFRGRSMRREFWYFHLAAYGLLIAFVWFSEAVGESASSVGSVVDSVAALLILGFLIPMLSVSVRRLHDQDMSGWFYLFSFIPLIGWIIWIVMMSKRGSEGPNGYGDDPRNPGLGELQGVFE